MTLLDLKEYIKTKERVYKDYENKDAWNKKCLINIAKQASSPPTVPLHSTTRISGIWHKCRTCIQKRRRRRFGSSAAAFLMQFYERFSRLLKI